MNLINQRQSQQKQEGVHQVQCSTKQIWGSGRKPKYMQGEAAKVAAPQKNAGGCNRSQAEHKAGVLYCSKISQRLKKEHCWEI